MGVGAALWDADSTRLLTVPASHRPTLFVACSAADLQRPLLTGVVRIDAMSASLGRRSASLADLLETYFAATPAGDRRPRTRRARPAGVGADAAANFLARTGPAMLQAGVLTYRVARAMVALGLV